MIEFSSISVRRIKSAVSALGIQKPDLKFALTSKNIENYCARDNYFVSWIAWLKGLIKGLLEALSRTSVSTCTKYTALLQNNVTTQTLKIPGQSVALKFQLGYRDISRLSSSRIARDRVIVVAKLQRETIGTEVTRKSR